MDSKHKADNTIRLIKKLEHRLAKLSYIALSLVIQRVLSLTGFLDICPTDRRSFRGRYTSEGFDMHAIVESSMGKQPVLIQIKCQRSRVSRQSVDALRGTLLRHSVSQGVLVTTSAFSPQARIAAAAYTGRPIRLIDGMELARLMVALGVGIDGDSQKENQHLDEEVFRRLELFSKRYARPHHKNPSPCR